MSKNDTKTYARVGGKRSDKKRSNKKRRSQQKSRRTRHGGGFLSSYINLTFNYLKNYKDTELKNLVNAPVYKYRLFRIEVGKISSIQLISNVYVIETYGKDGVTSFNISEDDTTNDYYIKFG